MNNDTLVDYICSYTPSFWNRPGCERVLQAMRRVDRGKFVHVPAPVPRDIDNMIQEVWHQLHHSEPPNISSHEIPYLDTPLSIGYEQTCSQPSVVALMAVLLQLKEGMNVLEVGTGCGYNAAVLAEVVGLHGHVTSLERIAALADIARQNLSAHFNGECERRVTIIHGDGSGGYAENAPYHRVVFTAELQREQFDTAALVRQCPTGMFLYPECTGPLSIELYQEREMVLRLHLGSFTFVPLKRGVE